MGSSLKINEFKKIKTATKEAKNRARGNKLADSLQSKYIFVCRSSNSCEVKDFFFGRAQKGTISFLKMQFERYFSPLPMPFWKTVKGKGRNKMETIAEEIRESDIEKTDIIKKFILNAPPGQLRDVIKSLKTLCKGSGKLLAAIVPSFCLEHHVRQFTVIPLPRNCLNASLGGGETVHADNNAAASSIVVTRGLLLSTLTQFVIQHVTAKKAEVRAALEEYFYSAAAICSTDAVSNVSLSFTRMDFILVDPRNKLYIEMDPIESTVVRVLPFLQPATTSELYQTILLAIQYFITSSVAPPPATFVHHHVSKSSRMLGRFHQEIMMEVTKYVDRHYGFVEEQQLHGVIGTSVHNANLKMKRRSASFAVEFLKGETSLLICLCAERCELGSFWAGRWKSVFQISFTHLPTKDEKTIIPQLSGEVRIYTHYHEQGNVHMETSKVVQTIPFPEFEFEDNLSVGDNLEEEQQLDWALLSRKVMRRIRAEETNVQNEVVTKCAAAGEELLKGLRRKLPITKQLFDFRRATAISLSRGGDH